MPAETPTQFDIDRTVEVPIRALLNAAGALYALGNLFPFIANAEPSQGDHIAMEPACELLVAAGLAHRTEAGDDFMVDLDDKGWDLLNDTEDRAMSMYLSDLASRALNEAQRLTRNREAVA